MSGYTSIKYPRTMMMMTPATYYRCRRYLGVIFFLNIFLAAPGLRCGTQDLQSPLQLVGSLVVVRGIFLVAACRV